MTHPVVSRYIDNYCSRPADLLTSTLPDFKELENGQLCSSESQDKPLTSAEQCRSAAGAFKLLWGVSFYAAGHLPGCMHIKDRRDIVLWNRSPHPSEAANTNNPIYAAICITGEAWSSQI